MIQNNNASAHAKSIQRSDKLGKMPNEVGWLYDNDLIA